MSNDDFELDLTNYKDRVGSRVTPGRYRVYVEDAEMGQTSKKDPMINIWLLIQGGEYDGATIIDRLLPAHEKALFRVVGFMDAIGLPTPKKRMRLNVRAFVGKVLEVDIEDGEPYNGRVKSEIRGYFKVSQGGATTTTKVKNTPPPADLEEDEPTARSNPLDGLSEFASVGSDGGGDETEVDLSTLDLG